MFSSRLMSLLPAILVIAAALFLAVATQREEARFADWRLERSRMAASWSTSPEASTLREEVRRERVRAVFSLVVEADRPSMFHDLFVVRYLTAP